MTQMLDDVLSQVVAYRVRIPVRRIEQPLHALWPRLPKMFGQLPPVLALDPIQQACQIMLGSLPRIRSPEPPGNPVSGPRKVW